MFVATDLHGHTCHSDGCASPEEYVEHRRALGMKAIAIADHDVLAAVRAGARAAEQAKLLFIPAVEVTAHLHYGQSGEEQFHVLAYYPRDVLEGFRLEEKALYRRGLRVQQRWKEHVLAWLGGLPADDRERLGESELESLPAPMFPALQATIVRIVERRRELFESFRVHHVSFWSSEGPNADLFGWTPEECIEQIRSDGAIEVVAHPARYRDEERTLRIIDDARGVEVYTSRHEPEVAARYRELASSKNKLWTSSSDDHQSAPYVKPPCGTPLRTVERICKRPMSLAAIL